MRTTEQVVADQLRAMASHSGGTSSTRAQMLVMAATQLDPIGRCSDSYPFLALARDWNLDYGDVLWFVDYLQGNPDWNSEHRREAYERLSHEARGAIMRRLREIQQKED